ncbi:hypothetical protein HD806DRAFT_512938 [Xylariaceae sp. AK1471]|nr:hypothetical protein HD806DRAFT_512938 [Xylariaceae sp. AK1471]
MSQPQLLRIGRKFGKHDFGRFENITSNGSLGTKSLGQVTVDCLFQYKKSHWGVLTEEKNPAGIIYLDLNFHQPGDRRLKTATITVTLDDDSEELLRHFSGQSSSDAAKIPVHIGDYGPTQIVGEAKEADKIVEHNAAPEIDAGGFVGIGNMGRKSEKSFTQEYRWTFLGQKKPAKKHSSLYKILTWSLTENELNTQSFHHPTLHTAFAFQHGRQPFFIQVAIDGTLKSKRSGFRQIFSSWKDERFATTLVNFNGGEQFSKVLDQVAEGLPDEMEKANALKQVVQAESPNEPAHPKAVRPLMVANDVSPNNDALKDKELDTVFFSLLYPSKVSGEEGNQMPQNTCSEPRRPKVSVDDRLATDDRQNMRERIEPPQVEEQEKNDQDSIQYSNKATDQGEAKPSTTLDLTTRLKVQGVQWNQLVRHTLQVLGLLAILKVLLSLLTLWGIRVVVGPRK